MASVGANFAEHNCLEIKVTFYTDIYSKVFANFVGKEFRHLYISCQESPDKVKELIDKKCIPILGKNDMVEWQAGERSSQKRRASVREIEPFESDKQKGHMDVDKKGEIAAQKMHWLKQRVSHLPENKRVRFMLSVAQEMLKRQGSISNG